MSRAIAAPPPIAGHAPIERGEAQSGGPLDLRGPALLLLGRDEHAEITVAGDDATPPTLAVSAGTIGAPHQGTDGRWRALYAPPGDRWPGLVFVTATVGPVGDGGAPLVDWLAIPLWAQPRIELRSEPEAEVRVRVAGRIFGPVHTDQAGRATLLVEVPPDEGTAELLAGDRLGNEQVTVIPLPSPPIRHVYALCPARWPRADAPGSARIDVLVADGKGRPRPGARLAGGVSHGALGATREVAPGRYEVEVSPPAAATDPIVFHVALDESLRGPEARCVLPSVPRREPTPVAASAASGVSTATGTLRVAATPARPRGGVAARIGYLTNLGKVSAAVALLEGLYRAPWVGGSFGLGARVGVWGSQRSGLATVSGDTLTLSLAALPLLAHVHYFLPLRTVGVQVAVGGGVVWSWTSLDSASGGTVKISGASPAASGLVGVDLPIGRGRVGVEIGFLYAPIHQAALTGNLGGLHVTAGYQLLL